MVSCTIAHGHRIRPPTDRPDRPTVRGHADHPAPRAVRQHACSSLQEISRYDERGPARLNAFVRQHVALLRRPVTGSPGGTASTPRSSAQLVAAAVVIDKTPSALRTDHLLESTTSRLGGDTARAGGRLAVPHRLGRAGSTRPASSTPTTPAPHPRPVGQCAMAGRGDRHPGHRRGDGGHRRGRAHSFDPVPVPLLLPLPAAMASPSWPTPPPPATGAVVIAGLPSRRLGQPHRVLALVIEPRYVSPAESRKCRAHQRGNGSG
jgi:hypothetical protein